MGNHIVLWQLQRVLVSGQAHPALLAELAGEVAMMTELEVVYTGVKIDGAIQNSIQRVDGTICRPPGFRGRWHRPSCLP